MINILPKQNGHSSPEKKIIFRKSFARISRSLCVIRSVAKTWFICRETFAHLSRGLSVAVFRQKKKQSFAKLSGSFREALLKHFNGRPLLNPLQGAFDRSSHEQLHNISTCLLSNSAAIIQGVSYNLQLLEGRDKQSHLFFTLTGSGITAGYPHNHLQWRRKKLSS